MKYKKGSIAFTGLSTALIIAVLGFLSQEKFSPTISPYDRLSGEWSGNYHFEGTSTAKEVEDGSSAMSKWSETSGIWRNHERQNFAKAMMIGRTLEGLSRQQVITRLGSPTKLEKCNPTLREGWPPQCLVYDLTFTDGGQDWFYFCIELRNDSVSNIWVQENN